MADVTSDEMRDESGEATTPDLPSLADAVLNKPRFDALVQVPSLADAVLNMPRFDALAQVPSLADAVLNITTWCGDSAGTQQPNRRLRPRSPRVVGLAHRELSAESLGPLRHPAKMTHTSRGFSGRSTTVGLHQPRGGE